MKKIVIFILICNFISSCSNTNNELQEVNLKSLKKTNKQLETIIDIYSEDYYDISNIFGVDESYFKWENELKKIINQLSSDKEFEEYEKLIETLNKKRLDEITLDINKKLIYSEIGKEILINRILTAILEVLIDFLDAQKRSNFQVNSIKLSAVNYDIKYKDTINLDVELVYRNWFPNEKLIYDNDTIFIDSTSRNLNVFKLKVVKPDKGRNEILMPFSYTRWGREVVDTFPIYFNVY